MCSIGEDDFGDEGGLHAMQPDPKPAVPTMPMCKGCGPPDTVMAVVKLPCKEAQCAQCFLAYVRHKFRANLGANKMIPRGGRVLVCYDGAANSAALLDMIRYGTQLDRFKKLHIEPVVLYVDEHCLTSDSSGVRSQHLQRIQSLVQQFGLQTYYVSVANLRAAQCVPLDIADVSAETMDCSAETDFVQVVSAFETLTARQEFVHSVRTNIIRECAERLNCRFVFTADTCPDLAVKLLANISLGRGSSVADDVSFCDDRGATVKILRPIRDFSTLEISEYVRLAQVQCCSGDATGEGGGVCSYGTLNDEFSSIQNLTRAFVNGLQADYQSTVSTVFRTGSKIAAVSKKPTPKQQHRSQPQQETTTVDVDRCRVCLSALDCERSETLLAVEFSRQCVLQVPDEDAIGGHTVKDTVWQSTMCYGCRNMFRDVKEASMVENAVSLLNG